MNNSYWAVVIKIENIESQAYLEQIGKKKSFYPKYTTLEEAFEKGQQESNLIIFDMTDLRYINSLGMALLVRGSNLLKKKKGVLVLSALRIEIKALLKMLELDNFFTMFENVKDCLNSMNWEIKKIIQAQIEMDC
jgi:anti-anti-sigma factor